MTPVQKTIVDTARSYVGQREKPGNSGFINPIFEAKMKVVGWVKGWPWCALFGELVLREAYQKLGDQLKVSKIGELFSPMATDTFNRFKRAGCIVSTTPQIGDVVVWKHGNGPAGHLGIVVDVGAGSKFTTVEGNTNAKGGREGEEVAVKDRYTGLPHQSTGLNLVGFIRPI